MRFEVVHAYLAWHCFFLLLPHVPVGIQNAAAASEKTKDPGLHTGNTGPQTLGYGLLPKGVGSHLWTNKLSQANTHFKTLPICKAFFKSINKINPYTNTEQNRHTKTSNTDFWRVSPFCTALVRKHARLGHDGTGVHCLIYQYQTSIQKGMGGGGEWGGGGRQWKSGHIIRPN